MLIFMNQSTLLFRCHHYHYSIILCLKLAIKLLNSSKRGSKSACRCEFFNILFCISKSKSICGYNMSLENSAFFKFDAPE
mgnify:CR=1 FL=1